MSDAPVPVDQALLHDLRRRLVAFRPLVLPKGVGWDRGTDADYLADIVAYWAESYDWREHESRILAYPWARTNNNGFNARSIHQRTDDASAPAVVLLHGWPDSVLRFERVLPLLKDLHVVIPCLPGFPFAEPVTMRGMSTTAMGDVVAGVMSEGAYMHGQATKPHTLAVGLGDSPAGLAAWIVEKLRSWSDCGGDVESVFAREDLLTWITAYWVTGSIGTSFSPYVEPDKPGERHDVPTAFSMFAHDLVNAPRSFADRFFNVQFWDEQPAGGHFAAWERPDAYVAGVRAAVAAQAGSS